MILFNRLSNFMVMRVDAVKVGKFIAKLRKSKKLTQEQLSRFIPVTRQAVSCWETGKALPDSETLLILSSLFDVTADEILRGERRKEPDPTITLQLLDDYNIKNKTVRRVIKISITFITTLIFVFLMYYFINSYNSIKVFKIAGEGKDFRTYKGIMVTTKRKTYLRLGELESDLKEYKIESVKLYSKDKNKKDILYEDDKTDILLMTKSGYNESIKNYKELLNNLYLEINYNDRKETIKLNLEQDFANNFDFEVDEKEIVNKENIQLEKSLIYENIKIKMQEKGQKENNNYTLNILDNNEEIKFTLIENSLLLEIKNKEITESWRGYFSHKFSLTYRKVENGIEKQKTDIVFNKDNLSKTNQIIYKKLLKYVDKYLLK